jgi:hypothetical protein
MEMQLNMSQVAKGCQGKCCTVIGSSCKETNPFKGSFTLAKFVGKIISSILLIIFADFAPTYLGHLG